MQIPKYWSKSEKEKNNELFITRTLHSMETFASGLVTKIKCQPEQKRPLPQTRRAHEQLHELVEAIVLHMVSLTEEAGRHLPPLIT
ncbi:hypothetical protein NECAME_07369 [Necator americanus]|uniref:Uncharacterized protein n=1 Tax=Necator americanus TaxID=51031 RepID=W2TR81_NECAM|nr:hypothetical protein NECAME_07369 [Necator americanus]ETN83547.1 hypothetical protein NECAME_07369 [Necator americanus]